MKCPNCGVIIKPKIKLTEKQQRRWELYYLEGKTIEEIARIEKVWPRAIEKSIKQVGKRVENPTLYREVNKS